MIREIIIVIGLTLVSKAKRAQGINGIGRTVFGGNSGYSGYSKSKRAIEAEHNGLMNKSQMNKSFVDEVNEIIYENGKNRTVTLAEIKRHLTEIQPDEWHHTSMYGNRTNYYSAQNVAEFFIKQMEKEQPPIRKFDIVSALQDNIYHRKMIALADEFNMKPKEIKQHQRAIEDNNLIIERGREEGLDIDAIRREFITG